AIAVKRDGAVIDRAAWDTAVPVDPAPHVVEASAEGAPPFRVTVLVNEPGKTVVVNLPPFIEARAPLPAPARASTPRRALAIAAAGVGVVSLGVGTYFSLRAKAQWDDAHAAGHCDNRDTCDPAGLSLAQSAKTAANVSTATFIGGGAAIGAAAVLWL